MLHLKQSLMCAALLAGMSALQGCALFVIGAVAGGAVGAVSYAGNELRVVHEVSVDRAWNAAQGAVEELRYSIIAGETRKDATGGTVTARNAKDQPVRIQLLRQSDRLTDVRIRVGTFNTAANRAAAQLLYDQMKARL